MGDGLRAAPERSSPTKKGRPRRAARSPGRKRPGGRVPRGGVAAALPGINPVRGRVVPDQGPVPRSVRSSLGSASIHAAELLRNDAGPGGHDLAHPPLRQADPLPGRATVAGAGRVDRVASRHHDVARRAVDQDRAPIIDRTPIDEDGPGPTPHDDGTPVDVDPRTAPVSIPVPVPSVPAVMPMPSLMPMMMPMRLTAMMVVVVTAVRRGRCDREGGEHEGGRRQTEWLAHPESTFLCVP